MFTPEVEKMIAITQQMKDQGASQTYIIGYLHDNHMSITNAMVVIRQIYNTNLTVAKQAVTSHSAWRTETLANKPMVDEIIDMAKEEGWLQELPDGTVVGDNTL